MGKIIAIGGGEIGRHGCPVETTPLDMEIISLSGKPHPKLLFIPTASADSESYVDAVVEQFGKRLGCKVDILYLLKHTPDIKEIEEKILSTDIVYVGGGNTLRMMKTWRKLGVDRILKRAYEKGTVLSGISAGAICWFKYGSSDSRKARNPDAGLIRVRGLNLIDASYCPHYDSEKDRKPHLKTLMQRTPGVAIAVEDCCALEIVEDEFRIISAKNSSRAFRVYGQPDECHEELLENRREFQPVEKLITKRK